MIKLDILSDVEYNANLAGEPGFTTLPVRIRTDKTQLAYINEQDIVSCYPCKISKNYEEEKGGWKFLVRGETTPIYCMDNPLKEVE